MPISLDYKEFIFLINFEFFLDSFGAKDNFFLLKTCPCVIGIVEVIIEHFSSRQVSNWCCKEM